jgi:magnesium chelatase family protein
LSDIVGQAQAKRHGSSTKLNSDMNNQDIIRTTNISDAAKTILDAAAQKMAISARSYMRAVKVARTIADLDQSDIIAPQHISEALRYRNRESV